MILLNCNKYEYFVNETCKKTIKFNPDYINNNYLMNNNCYSYAINNFKAHSKKIQPGHYSNISKIKKKKEKYTCDNFSERILKDNKYSYKIDNENDDCLCGYHKIALFLDNKDPHLDYHFYRKDYDAKEKKFIWSHKPGNNTARNYDASNNPISNPLESDRDFSKIKGFKHNYDKFCSFYCIKTNL